MKTRSANFSGLDRGAGRHAVHSYLCRQVQASRKRSACGGELFRSRWVGLGQYPHARDRFGRFLSVSGQEVLTLTHTLGGRPRAVRQDADAHSGQPTTSVDAGVRKHGRSRRGQREEQPVSPQARQPHPPSRGPQPNDEPDRGSRNARRRRTRSCSQNAPFCVNSRFASPATNLAKRVAVGEGILLVRPPPSVRPGRYYRYSSLLIQYVNKNAPP